MRSQAWMITGLMLFVIPTSADMSEISQATLGWEILVEPQDPGEAEALAIFIAEANDRLLGSETEEEARVVIEDVQGEIRKKFCLTFAAADIPIHQSFKIEVNLQKTLALANTLAGPGIVWGVETEFASYNGYAGEGAGTGVALYGTYTATLKC